MLLGLAGGGKAGGISPTPSSPTLSTAIVPADGLTLALTFIVPTEPLLPEDTITGLTVTVAGAGATFTAARTSNTVITLTMTTTIYDDQVVTVAYTAGNITDSLPTALGNFTAQAVTNNSTATATYVATKSIAFGGTDEYCNRADAAVHDVTTTMTLSAWVKGAATQDYTAIVSKTDNAVANNYNLLRSGDVAAKWSANISGGGNNKRWSSSVTVFDNTWHHVAYTFSSGTLAMYNDRVLDTGPPTKTVDGAVASLTPNSVGLRIGSNLTNGTPSAFFVGSITNVSLWNIALDQTGINALATAGKPADLTLHANYANCVSWYKCGDGDTIGANGILDTKGGLHMSPSNMESGDIVTDAP